MFYYLMTLMIIIVILILFSNKLMKTIRDQQDTIDDLNITISNFKTTKQIKEEIILDNNHKFKQEYLQLNWNTKGELK